MAATGPSSVDIAAPFTLSAPVVATFPGPVSGITNANLVLRPAAGGAAIPASISCRAAGGAKVNCGGGQVTVAILQPRRPLVAGAGYEAFVDPAGAAAVSCADAPASSATWVFRAAPAVEAASAGVTRSAGWRVLSHAGTAVLVSGRRGATVRFAFSGPEVDWLAPSGPGQGRALVSVDGRLGGSVSERARIAAASVVHRVTGLRNGPHVLTIAVARGNVSVGGFRVEGPAPAALPDTEEIVAHALAEHRIAADAALVDEAYATTGDPRLPAVLAGNDTSSGGAETSLNQIEAAWPSLSAAMKRRLGGLFLPPNRPGSAWAGGGAAHAVAHAADTLGGEGWESVNSSQARVWWPSAVPGDAAIARSALEDLTGTIWQREVNLMERSPVSSAAYDGGDGRLEIFIHHCPADYRCPDIVSRPRTTAAAQRERASSSSTTTPTTTMCSPTSSSTS
jgi:hypothetical protein